MKNGLIGLKKISGCTKKSMFTGILDVIALPGLSYVVQFLVEPECDTLIWSGEELFTPDSSVQVLDNVLDGTGKSIVTIHIKFSSNVTIAAHAVEMIKNKENKNSFIHWKGEIIQFCNGNIIHKAHAIENDLPKRFVKIWYQDYDLAPTDHHFQIELRGFEQWDEGSILNYFGFIKKEVSEIRACRLHGDHLYRFTTGRFNKEIYDIRKGNIFKYSKREDLSDLIENMDMLCGELMRVVGFSS